MACGGLDNKLTVFPLALEEDATGRKKVVGTHTSYTSCCLFPGSDNQVEEQFNMYTVHCTEFNSLAQSQNKITETDYSLKYEIFSTARSFEYILLYMSN